MLSETTLRWQISYSAWSLLTTQTLYIRIVPQGSIIGSHLFSLYTIKGYVYSGTPDQIFDKKKRKQMESLKQIFANQI